MMKLLAAFVLFIGTSAFSLSRASQNKLSATVNAHGDLKMVRTIYIIVHIYYYIIAVDNLIHLYSLGLYLYTYIQAASVTLPPLPYAYNALEPHIGEQTLKIHHDKHHARYVDVTNQMITGTDLEGKDVVTILRSAYGKNQGLFNNAAQSFNHAFYWDCMKPNGGGKPTGKVATLIDKYLGGYDKFRADFINAGMTAFGSGW